MTLHVVRHAPTDAAGRCVGRSFAAVTVPAAEAAERMAAQLASHGARGPRFERVWSSPAPRCADPARHLARALGAEVRVDPRLHEIDMGAFQGRTWAAIEAEAPEAMARWMERWEREGPPGGESAQQLAARIAGWLPEARPDDVLVAHAGVVRALWHLLEGAPWPEVMARPVAHLALLEVPLDAQSRESIFRTGSR